MRQAESWWAIEYFHPRSSSIRHIARTRKDALAKSLDSYAGALTDPERKAHWTKLWHENRAAGLFRPVRVTITWDGR